MENSKLDKQIEEMANDLYTCHDEYVRDGDDWVTDYNSTAKKTLRKGYRKASEVAREIFEEIEEKGKVDEPIVEYYILSYSELAELKKKYTESEKDK